MGGVVTVVETAGLDQYQGSSQNGVDSNSWGSWDPAFFFVVSPTPTPTNSVTQSCGGSLNQPTGNITSPNWPDLYEPRDSCEWRITAPAEGYITLSFTSFNLTGSLFSGDECQLTDTVTVYDGYDTDGDVIATLCSARPPLGLLRSSGRHMFVTFRARRVGRYPGFFAVYTAVSSPVSPADCSYALGLENRHIQDAQLSASSQLPIYEAWKARLNGPIAWQFNVSHDRQPWLQINLTTNHYVSGVQTQGKWGGWLTSYMVMYSVDGLTWTSFGEGKVFPANSNGVNTTQNILDPPILATYVRIYPFSWNGNLPRLRLELLGCTSELTTMSPTSNLTTTSPAILTTSNETSTSLVQMSTSSTSSTSSSTDHPTLASTEVSESTRWSTPMTSSEVTTMQPVTSAAGSRTTQLLTSVGGTRTTQLLTSEAETTTTKQATSAVTSEIVSTTPIYLTSEAGTGTTQVLTSEIGTTTAQLVTSVGMATTKQRMTTGEATSPTQTTPGLEAASTHYLTPELVTTTTKHVTSEVETTTTKHVTSEGGTTTTKHVTSEGGTATTKHVTSEVEATTTKHVTSEEATTIKHVTSEVGYTSPLYVLTSSIGHTDSLVTSPPPYTTTASSSTKMTSPMMSSTEQPKPTPPATKPVTTPSKVTDKPDVATSPPTTHQKDPTAKPLTTKVTGNKQTTKPPTASELQSGGKSSIIPIAAGAGGAALLLLIIIIVSVVCYKKNKARQTEEKTSLPLNEIKTESTVDAEFKDPPYLYPGQQNLPLAYTSQLYEQRQPANCKRGDPTSIPRQDRKLGNVGDWCLARLPWNPELVFRAARVLRPLV
ncbi:hypothetical protein Bbelb_162780 [Branchiostoma belcheri]|nr:hypothetical protein Bbelb_162780 [Branchiostoma belcheri]